MPKHANKTPHAEEVRRASIYMLNEQMKPHAGEVRRAQGAEQTRVIGN